MKERSVSEDRIRMFGRLSVLCKQRLQRCYQCLPHAIPCLCAMTVAAIGPLSPDTPSDRQRGRSKASGHGCYLLARTVPSPTLIGRWSLGDSGECF